MDEVILVTNNRPVNNERKLLQHGIKTLFVKNEGYDLGMFYKAFQTINPDDYHQIACVNDSNILINKLTTLFAWGNSSGLDVWGAVDSHEKPPFSTHRENYHIQSHFIVFNEKAIVLLPIFFNSIDVQDLFKETHLPTLRGRVIDQWEIGISQFMIQNGLKAGSFINSQLYTSLYISGEIRNISRRLYSQMVSAGYPMIKKKVIMDRQLKYILRGMPGWKKLIRQYGKPDWKLEHLINELEMLRADSPKRLMNKLKRKWQKLGNYLNNK